MKLLEKILVPVDFTESSERAVATALETAKTFKSDVYLIHVIPELNVEGIPMDMVKDNVTKKLSEVSAQFEKSGITVKDSIVENGSAIERILRYADFLDVNVIISGSGAAEKSKHLGTTAGKLIRKSSKPVWVVKESAGFTKGEVLAPVDFSSSSARALRNAIHIARQFGKKLHVLTVVKDISSSFYGLFTASEEKQKAYENSVNEKFDQFLKNFDLTGVEYIKTVLKGKPHEEILKYITDNSISLTVIGSVGDSSDSFTIIGSVAEKVVRELPSSLITVKSEDAIALKIEAEMNDINECTLQGNELLKNGLPREAVNHYRHCLTIDPLYSKAWNSMAEAYKRMGDDKSAEESVNTSKEIEERLWTRKVEAEIKYQKFRK